MNRKTVARILAAAVIASMTMAAYAKAYTVKELNNGPDGSFVFEPAYLHVQPGDTVNFVPTDAGHDSHAYLVPAGATEWASQVGKPISVTLKQQGVYLYECVPHHMMGMLGVIEVGKPANKAAADKAAATMEGQQVMNKGRLQKLMAQVK